jgi:membrane protease YdiL (CAAX protease family)
LSDTFDQSDREFRPVPGVPPPSGSVPPPGYRAETTAIPHLESSQPEQAPTGEPPLNWKTGVLGIGVAIGLIIGAFTLLGIGAALSGMSSQELEDSKALNFIGTLLQDACLVGAVFFAVNTAVSGRPVAATFGLRPFRRSAFGWAFLGLVVFFGVILAYASVVEIPDDPDKVEDQLGGPLTVVAAVGIAPFVEEFFFRGLLYRSFRASWGVAAGALISGLLFGVVHLGSAEAVVLPILAAFGVILALVYEKTQSLWPCIMLHTAYNAIAVTQIVGS